MSALDGLIFNESINFDDERNDDIHIRITQNGRKSLTWIEGLNKTKKELKLILKQLIKKLAVGGCITKTNDNQHIIGLQGDHRESVKLFLIKQFNISKDNIIIHGY
mmetsp:Transcript_23291/g.28571  ORF Transcript_23291/g.28571 Transcript_23291/m.28571 type:complete len:106 (-) Transcript_23291:169-486(-)